MEVEPSGETLFYNDGIFNTAYQFDMRYRYPHDITMQVKSGNASIRLEGDEGWVESDGWNNELTASRESILDMAEKKFSLPTAPNEFVNFLESIREGLKPVNSYETGHRTSTLLHMGNIALKLNRKVEWDPVAEKFVNDPEAEKFRKREMRDKWNYNKICPEYKY